MLLKNLSNEKLFEVVSKNETLRRSFDDFVWEHELDYISDKLAVVKTALTTWEIGLCNPNFIRVKDYGLFVYYARECEKIFGLSEKAERCLALCEKLEDTNLFKYHAKRFAKMWFDEEIQDTVKWVENLSYDVSCGKNPENAYDYLECWKDFVDYIFDEETEEVFEPMRKVS